MDNFTETLQHFSVLRLVYQIAEMEAPSIDTNVSVIHPGDAASSRFLRLPHHSDVTGKFTFRSSKVFRDWISHSSLVQLTPAWHTAIRNNAVHHNKGFRRNAHFFIRCDGCNPANNLSWHRQHCVKSSIKSNSQSNKFYALSARSYPDIGCRLRKDASRRNTRSSRVNTLWLLCQSLHRRGWRQAPTTVRVHILP